MILRDHPPRRDPNAHDGSTQRSPAGKNGVRSSLSTFVHERIEFKCELAPAVFFFCARDHLRNRSVGRATKKCANFSEPHPAAVPDLRVALLRLGAAVLVFA